MSPEPNRAEPEILAAATHEVNTIGTQVEANVRSNLASEELDSVAFRDSEVDNKSEDSFSNENINEETKSSISKPESQVKYIVFEA
uniref:Uncharacterized protein n=1 Tax=Amphimedon queenslandica TaxID=400682 RepID=A0A1X7U5I8_AMPQE